MWLRDRLHWDCKRIISHVQVQKLTDDFIKDVDSMCEGKEAELKRI